MALGPDRAEGLRRALERLQELHQRQRAALLAWRMDELSALNLQAEVLQRACAADLRDAGATEFAEFLPRLRQAQALSRANRDLLQQALAVVREWLRILRGASSLSYDRRGRPVAAAAAAAGERVV